MIDLVLDMRLEKGHTAVFVGPRGGRWADAAHTIPYHEGNAVPDVDVARLLRGNLGIDRVNMPQIASALVPEFVAQLTASGVTVSNESFPAHALRATQNKLDAAKIRNEIERGDLEHLRKPVVVSKDHFLLDGHHRWAAIVIMNPGAVMSIIRVGLPIGELIARAREFAGVTFKKAEIHNAGLPTQPRMMSMLGNEDAPRPTRAAELTGALDEMGLTLKGKKKRKKARVEAQANARERKAAHPDLFVSLKRPKHDNPRTAREFVPLMVEDVREAATVGRSEKADRARDEIERRKEIPPLRDDIRAARARGKR